MQEGTAAGIVARQSFPQGVLVDIDNRQFDAALIETAKLCADPKVVTIFEAAFQYQNLRVRVDVLCRVGAGWKVGIIPDKELDYLIGEVKSSTKVKPHHRDDLSFQVYVLRKLGMVIVDAMMMIINSDYVYAGGAHDLAKLFKMELAQPKPDIEIEAELKKQSTTLSQPEPPDIACGSHCKTPYVCEFLEHCHPYVPGFTPHEVGVAAANPLRYPLHFLDFETISTAIPIFPGTKPWAQIPIQWSCRNWSGPGSQLESLEFLHDNDSDPRRAFADSVYKAIGEKGSIIIYTHCEKTVLRKLAEEFPEYQKQYKQAESRMWDLYTYAVRRIYSTDDPAFNGSLSLKSVVRTLLPTIKYASLTIGNGDEAMKAWRKLIYMPASKEREQLLKDLAEYCGVDTLAMVGVVGMLWSKLTIN